MNNHKIEHLIKLKNELNNNMKLLHHSINIIDKTMKEQCHHSCIKHIRRYEFGDHTAEHYYYCCICKSYVNSEIYRKYKSTKRS